MSRQFRFFLLPSDIEALVAELRTRVSLKIIQERTPTSETVELETPIHKGVAWLRNSDAMSVRCYLIPPIGAEVRVKFIAKQSYWLVDEEHSEVIEFSGCDFDGETLMIGRFYFQTDMLIGDTIWPKRPEFLKWADRIFRTMKKPLRYSKSMEAYVGKDADEWRKSGGCFAHFIRANGEPIYSLE